MGEIRAVLDIVARNLGELWPLAIALALAAISVSGRFSVTATQILLCAAWIVALLALRNSGLIYFIGGAFVTAVLCASLAVWFRPETVPLYFGELIPKRELLFSSAKEISKDLPHLEIGNSGAVFSWGGPAGQPMFKLYDIEPFIIERIRGKIKVSSTIRDESGEIVASLVRNQWKVAPPPKTWDRNYNSDSLEVIDAKGHVVLQVKALSDRIQLQGIWRGSQKSFVALSAAKGGGNLTIRPPNGNPAVVEPVISPMFGYPSDSHFGELIK